MIIQKKKMKYIRWTDEDEEKEKQKEKQFPTSMLFSLMASALIVCHSQAGQTLGFWSFKHMILILFYYGFLLT